MIFCRKELILTGYRVQYIDLREPKPRTPREEIHVADRQWLEAIGLVGLTAAECIKKLYEGRGYKVFAMEPIKPKRVVGVDLKELWAQAEPPAGKEDPAEEGEPV